MSRKLYTSFEIDCFRVHLEYELQNAEGLIRLSEHRHWLVRLSAVKALSANIWRHGVINRLFQALDDPSWIVRLAICVILCREAVSQDSTLRRLIESKLAEMAKHPGESIFRAFAAYYLVKYAEGSMPAEVMEAFETDTAPIVSDILQIIRNTPQSTPLNFQELRRIDSLTFLILKRGPLADYQIQSALNDFEKLNEIEQRSLVISTILKWEE